MKVWLSEIKWLLYAIFVLCIPYIILVLKA